jgi:hypothetical protein
MAHDLATRRVRKGLLTGANGSEPRAKPEAPAPDQNVPVPPEIGEHVVADVRHEIGNYFHKLYYWADFLTESRSGRAGDVTATQMLEETIRGLEQLLQATLEYVRPMAVSPIRMHAREVADGVLRQLASAFAGRVLVASLDETLPGERELMVDPGRLSQVLAALVRRVETTMDTAHPLDARVIPEVRSTVEVLAVYVTGVANGAGHSTLTEVEWATAENAARLAGGELTTHEAGDRIRIALTLPLRS